MSINTENETGIDIQSWDTATGCWYDVTEARPVGGARELLDTRANERLAEAGIPGRWRIVTTTTEEIVIEDEPEDEVIVIDPPKRRKGVKVAGPTPDGGYIE